MVGAEVAVTLRVGLDVAAIVNNDIVRRFGRDRTSVFVLTTRPGAAGCRRRAAAVVKASRVLLAVP